MKPRSIEGKQNITTQQYLNNFQLSYVYYLERLDEIEKSQNNCNCLKTC